MSQLCDRLDDLRGGDQRYAGLAMQEVESLGSGDPGYASTQHQEVSPQHLKLTTQLLQLNVVLTYTIQTLEGSVFYCRKLIITECECKLCKQCLVK